MHALGTRDILYSVVNLAVISLLMGNMCQCQGQCVLRILEYPLVAFKIV